MAPARGGWADAAIVDRFTRFCERSVAALGDLIGMGCTINEPNIVSLMGYVSAVFPPAFATSRVRRVNENMIAADRKSYDAIESGPATSRSG